MTNSKRMWFLSRCSSLQYITLLLNVANGSPSRSREIGNPPTAPTNFYTRRCIFFIKSAMLTCAASGSRTDLHRSRHRAEYHLRFVRFIETNHWYVFLCYVTCSLRSVTYSIHGMTRSWIEQRRIIVLFLPDCSRFTPSRKNRLCLALRPPDGPYRLFARDDAFFQFLPFSLMLHPIDGSRHVDNSPFQKASFGACDSSETVY